VVKTIVYVGGFELPDKNAAAQRVLNNARVMRAIGHRVVLLGISHTRPYDRKLHPADAGGDDLEAWEIGYPAGRGDWFDHILADWSIRALAENGIVAPGELSAVICYNYPAVAQWRIARLARKWGAAAIADCTEWYGRRPWTSLANIVKNVDVPLRMLWVNRRMDGLITTSPYITEFYRPTGLPIVEIPTLMDRPDEVSPSIAVGEGEAAIPISLFAVASGFAEGTRAEDVHDRIDWTLELLDAVATRAGDFVLRIAGVGRERYLSTFPAHGGLLDRLGERVIFLDRIPRVELLRQLQASAFAFVLRHESRVTMAGFPSKYSEAVTYGTPCIINALPSVRAYHVEGKTGFTIDPGDRDEAERRLYEILTMDVEAIMAMKRYCRGCGAFNAEAFKDQVTAFMSALNGDEGACP
jgi:Glycosyltransferase